jgi:regulator of sigma E protease
MIVLYVLYAIVGVSIIIFIHEAGHYLAAKKAGVRVERFSLGFDPPFRGRPLRIFSFRAGETEYILGMIPFGGYVKLAGEAIADPSKTAAPDELLSKSVGARAFVFAAGSIMNVLSAFVFFMIAFTMGVSFLAPTVGSLVPEMPGWQAGLRPGDRITAIDGKEIVDFTEMRLAVVLGSSETPREFTVERPVAGGGTETLSLAVTPRFDEDLGFSEVGVRPAYSGAIEEPGPGSAAAAAGLRAGDRIVGLEAGGRKLPPLTPTTLVEAIQSLMVFRPDRPLRLEVARGEGVLTVDLEPRRRADRKPASQIGVQPGAGTIVSAVQPGSAAEGRLRPGDEVRAIDGDRVHTIHWILLAERPEAKDVLELEIASEDGELRKETVGRDDFLRWNLLGEIAWAARDAEVASIEPESQLARAGLQKGDVLAGLDGRRIFSLEKLAEALRSPSAGSATLRVIRAGKPTDLPVDRKALREGTGIQWAEVPPVAIAVRGGPAEAAGIQTGARFLRAGAKSILRWEELTEAVSDTRPGEELEIAWREPGGSERSARVKVGLQPMEDLPFEEDMTTVHAGILGSFGLGLQRTVVTSKQIFLTLKSLIRREVATKNLAGPVGITHLLTKVVEQGKLSTLIYFLALISINLGLFNLLPFPILDGGHLLFLAIEKVKGSPVDIRIQEWAMNIAFLLILALAIWVTYNDIHRLIG